MIIKANITEAVRSLLSSKQRTLLALLGIVIGIGSVIAMVSVGTFVQYEAIKQFKEMGTDILTIEHDAFSGSGGGMASGKSGVKLDVVTALPTNCPDIGQVAPYITVYGDAKFNGNRFNAPALAVTNSAQNLFKLKVLQGRFISDLDRFMFFCVVGSDVAEKIKEFGDGDILGQKISFQDRLYTIIGEVEKVAMGGMRPYAINEGIIIPITTALRFPDRPKIENITARMTSEGQSPRASAQVIQYFQQNSSPFIPRITSAEELIGKMEKQMQLFTLLLAAIGSISLIVGGVGVMNVMLVAVSERRKEIGIRRALGATRGDIQSQFLIESIILCIIGGILGIGLGLGSSYIIARFSNWEFFISYNAVIVGFVVSAIVGVFFGFFPARQAARLSPIDALRSD